MLRRARNFGSAAGRDSKTMSEHVSATTEMSGVKIPLRLRLKAWWQGYELEVRRKVKPIESGGKEHDVRFGPGNRWGSARIALAQQVWGEGFVVPGGEDTILGLVNPLGLNPQTHLLELGAGLGGAARLMAKHFGVWVTGLEADHQLAEAGMELSTMAGLAKKAPVRVFDPEHFEESPKVCDRVFSKEFLFTVKDKDRLFRIIGKALKDRGHVLFTDYVLVEPDRRTPALEQWIAAEAVEPHPWTIEDYVKALKKLKLDIRIAEDISERMHRQIKQGWAGYLAQVDQAALDTAARAALADEIELWTRRTKLIEAGELKVCRIHAIKKAREAPLSDR